jgi:hypothetical protein
LRRSSLFDSPQFACHVSLGSSTWIDMEKVLHKFEEEEEEEEHHD